MPLTSPLFASTIPFIFIPRSERNLADFSEGLIKEARPDFNALAPSDALIPPSFMAVRKKAKSSTSPPSCLTTGPAFGIAIVKSSIAVMVWFSTAFKKLIFEARSSAAIPKAFVIDTVAFKASC